MRGALVLSLCLLIPAAPGVAGAGERVTKVVPVSRGARLEVRIYGGEVVLRGGARDEVRVRAERFGTDELLVNRNGDVLEIGVRHDRGPAHAIDLELDVPEWMPLSVKGTYLDISATGSHAGVVAESVRGDIRLRDCTGSLKVSAVDGSVNVEASGGQAEIHAVNNEVRVTGFRGALTVDSVNGAVTLKRVESSAVTVGTMGGAIDWDSPLASGGRYQFATHEGDIDLRLGTEASAAVSVRLFDGQFRSDFATGLAPDATRKKRFSFRLGSAAATLDLETFRGVVSLRGAPRPVRLP